MNNIKCVICDLPIVFDNLNGGFWAKWKHDLHSCFCGYKHEPKTDHEAKCPDIYCPHCGQTEQNCRDNNSPYGYRCSRF